MLKEDLSCWFMLMMLLLLPRLKMTLTGSTRSCLVDSMPRIWGRYIKSSVYKSTMTGRTVQFTLIKSNTSAQSSNDLVSLRAHTRTRRSVSGSVAIFYGGPISWSSKRQRSVATSSCESEYMALSACAKQGQWIAQVFRDLGYAKFIGKNPSCVQMLGDNQGALALV